MTGEQQVSKALVRQLSRLALGSALAAVSLAGCGRAPPPPPAPVPELATIDSSRVLTTVFLIGDAGAAASRKDRVLTELRRQAKSARRSSAIVFLGDNVYPRGIPHPEDSSRYKEAVFRLLVQAELADSTGVRVVFVPGNHDWARHGEDGWASVQRSDLLLEEYSKTRKVRVDQMPSMGCPGPEILELARGVRLVTIDTQWWLQSASRAGRVKDSTRRALPRPDITCSDPTEAGLIDSLTKTFRTPGDRLDIMVGHHPVESNSEHAGHFPWIQYLFPAIPTPIASWAWFPLGWIYPVGRRLVADRQDNFSKENRAMRRALEGTFRDDRPFIYASGHDHSLQVLKGGPNRYYLVSGSGIEDHQNPVRKSRATMFSSARPGFMRIDIFNRDSVRLGVTVVTKQNTAVESYRVWLRR